MFGRKTDLYDDVLHDFKKGEVEINETVYPIAIYEVGSFVIGKLLEATYAEIEMMDEYKTAAYKRITVVLESGKSSWVYCQP